MELRSLGPIIVNLLCAVIVLRYQHIENYKLSRGGILNASSCCQYLYLFTVFSTYVVSKLLLLASDGVWLLIVVQF